MSTYKPLSTDRGDVLRAKRTYGIWYGASLGFFFAFFTWGLDAYSLSQMNSLHPWLKFAAGALLSTIAGGLTGWLAAKRDKPIFAVPIWIVYGLFLAWLVVTLPTQIFPRLLGILEPDVQQYLHYVYYEEFSTRIGVAFAWILIFVSIVGLLQLPMSEGAVFSTSILGKLAPILVGLVLPEVVNGKDLVPSFQQPLRQMRPDKTRTTCNQNCHNPTAEWFPLFTMFPATPLDARCLLQVACCQ